MPLSFVIARYFAYAFAAVATAWLASFMALSAAINAGFVYEASWGPANAREVAVSVNLFFTSFAKQARRSRKGGFTGCANVFSPIPVTA